MRKIKFLNFLCLSVFCLLSIKCASNDKKGMLKFTDNSTTIIINNNNNDEEEQKEDIQEKKTRVPEVSDAAKWVIQELKHNKLNKLDEDLQSLIKCDLNQNEIDALGCFYSRIGKKELLLQSYVLKYIKKGSKYEAAEGFTHYRNKHKKLNQDFIKSGFIEACMFLNTKLDLDFIKKQFENNNINCKTANENWKHLKIDDINFINGIFNGYNKRL